MKRVVLVLLVIAAAALAQEFRWVWKDTVGKYVEWQGDQGSGSTVLMGPTATMEQCQVVGLSSGGSPSWTTRVDTITPEVGCVGAGGNIYLAGARRFPDYQAQLVALTSSGQERWRWLLNSPLPYNDHLTCVADNKQGIVFAGGDFDLGGSPSNLEVVSVDAATGATIDTMTFPVPCNGLFELACGAGSEAYGIGSVWTDTCVLYLIYRWDGRHADPDWILMMHGGGPGMNSVLHGLAVGSDGNVYVIGQTQYAISHDEFNLNQVNGASGTKNWAYTITDPVQTSVGIDVAVGDDNNVYALGQATNPSGGQDIVVVSLTSGGAVRWTYRFQPGGNRWAWAQAIKIGNDGSVYAFGYTGNTNYNSDMLIVCLTSEGGLRWTYQYDGGSDDYIHPDCGFYSSDGKLYAAGTTKEGSVTKSAAISVNSIIGIQEGPVSGRSSAFTRTTFARGELRLDADGTLFDSRGCKVADVSVGTNDVSRLAPGAYILRTRESGGAGSRVVVVK